jgi:hypothetical protein
VRLGALTLYLVQIGDLSAGQYADAISVARVATTSILAIQAKASPGTLSPHLEILPGSAADLTRRTSGDGHRSRRAEQ